MLNQSLWGSRMQPLFLLKRVVMLTDKQEKFAQGIAKGLTQADAYREAYDCENMKPESIWSNASQLASDTKVAQRVEELKERALKRYDVSVDDLIDELEEARTLSKLNSQPSAMVSATMGKAKLLGLVVDRQDTTIKGISKIDIRIVDADRKDDDRREKSRDRPC